MIHQLTGLLGSIDADHLTEISKIQRTSIQFFAVCLEQYFADRATQPHTSRDDTSLTTPILPPDQIDTQSLASNSITPNQTGPKNATTRLEFDSVNPNVITDIAMDHSTPAHTQLITPLTTHHTPPITPLTTHHTPPTTPLTTHHTPLITPLTSTHTSLITPITAQHTPPITPSSTHPTLITTHPTTPITHPTPIITHPTPLISPTQSTNIRLVTANESDERAQPVEGVPTRQKALIIPMESTTERDWNLKPLNNINELMVFILDHIVIDSIRGGRGGGGGHQLALCLLNVIISVVKAGPSLPSRWPLTCYYMDPIIHAYFEPSNAPLKASYLRVLLVLSYQIPGDHIDTFLSNYTGDLLAVFMDAMGDPTPPVILPFHQSLLSIVIRSSWRGSS